VSIPFSPNNLGQRSQGWIDWLPCTCNKSSFWQVKTILPIFIYNAKEIITNPLSSVKHCSIYSPSIILDALLRSKQALHVVDNMYVTIVLEYCAMALGELTPTLALLSPCVRLLRGDPPTCKPRNVMFLLMNESFYLA
jgi:hypothetical protein